MQEKNNFGKNTLFILLIRTWSVVTTLFLMLYFSHTLTKSEFGIWSSFWTQASMSMAIGSLGLPIFVFTYSKEKISRLLHHIPQKIKWFYRAWLLLVGVGFTCTQFYTNDLLQPSVFTFLGSTLFIAFGVAGLLYEALAIVFNFYRKLLVASSFYNAIYVALFLLFAFGKIGSELLILALMVNALVKYLLLEQQAFKVVGSSYIHIDEVKKNWIAIGLYDLSQSVIKHLDKYVLSFFLVQEMFATYSLLTYEIPIFALVFSSLRSSTSIFLSEQERSLKHIRIYVKQVGKLLGFFIIPAVLFLLFFAKDVVSLLFSEKYVAYAGLFSISVLKMLAYNFIFSAVLQYFERVPIINKGVWLDFIISLVLSVLFYQFWGVYGIMLAIVVSTFVQVLYYTYHTKIILEGKWQQLIPIQIWLKTIVLFSFIIGFLKLIFSWLPINGIWSMLICFLIVAPLAIIQIKRAYQKIKLL